MATTNVNGIRLNVRPQTGHRYAGTAWIEVPEAGVPADLLPHVARYLGSQQSGGDSLTVDDPTWESVRAEVDEKLAREAQDAAEKAERRTRVTAAWRGMAAAYLAGGSDIPTTCEGTVGGMWTRLTETDVTPEEIAAVEAEHMRRYAVAVTDYLAGGEHAVQRYDAIIDGQRAPSGSDLADKVRAEYDRREAVKGAAEFAAKVAVAQALIDARMAWLREHGAAEDVIERYEAGVLDDDELKNVICAALVPASLGGVPQYEAHSGQDIDHRDDCNQGGDCEVEWKVGDGSDDPLSSAQWAQLKAVRAAAAGIPGAVVDVREHLAHLSCDCPDKFWLAVRVRVELPALQVTVQRQYAL